MDLVHFLRIFLRDTQNFLRNPSVAREMDQFGTDPTTPWYEFNSYLDCCYSLKVKPSINRFIAYNRYYRSVEKNV